MTNNENTRARPQAPTVSPPGVDVRRSPWVQPILVAKGGTHAATVAAAARASVLAQAADPTNPSWDLWLSGPFTKTVRRTTAAKLTAAHEAAAAQGMGVALVEADDSLALAYTPHLTAALPREVVKAQVSGTDFPRTAHVTHTTRAAFTVIVDEALTTGKASAQAAHAVWMWMLDRQLDNPEQVAEWARNGADFNVVLHPQGHLRELEAQRPVGSRFVHDAGWTEVDPGTLTAAVVNR